MRIVISGYYGSNNAGDEAMLAAMIEIFVKLSAQVNITVISANPSETIERHEVDAVKNTDLCGIVRAIRRADLLISGGGSLLQNVTSERSLYYYMGVIILARLMGKPVMLYAQGIGPVFGSTARFLLKIVGNGTNLITVRDHGSLDELSEIGISRPPIFATADPVLAIEPVTKDLGRKILSAVMPLDSSKPLLGVAVRQWDGYSHYKEVFAEALRRVADALSATVVFIPMQFPQDIAAAETMAKDLSAVVLREKYSTRELMSLIGSMDLMVSIRLHALIFAAVMNVPMVGVSYDPKVDRFLESIGQRVAGHLESIGVESLTKECLSVWSNRVDLVRKTAEYMTELRHLSVRNAELAIKLAKVQEDSSYGK